MAQFGMHNSSSETLKWNKRKLPDDPALASNRRGTLSFASAGPNTRANQIFINFVDNAYLDNEGFAPFARVLSGMNIVDKLYSGYGEGGRGDGRDGKGPSQWRISQQGNQYLNEFFPRLSYIDYAALV
jgi:peptidyl-prolyl cis-trans isomerase A (cyclophilin A)